MTTLALAALMAWPVPVRHDAPNAPPTIQDETGSCVRAGGRAQVSAFVVDDAGVLKVRAVFRAAGTKVFYWTEMNFNGSLFSAWLPAPLAPTHALEYYIEAFDNDYEPARTATQQLRVDAECANAGQEPAQPTVVGTTAPRQPPSPPGFDPATFTPLPQAPARRP